VYAVHNKLSEEMYTVHKDTMKTAKKAAGGSHADSKEIES